MLCRRRSFLKYIIIFLSIWLVYFILFESHAENEDSIKNNKFIAEKIIKKLKELNILNSQKNHEENFLKEDHDHPIEEQRKAEKQNRHGKKQLNAPITHDLNAPGE